MLDSHPGTVEIAPVEVKHSVIGIPVVVEFLSKIESNVKIYKQWDLICFSVL